MARGRPPYPDVLTPAEWQVLFFIRKGLRNGEIAERRSTGIDAVKYHVSNMLAKLGLSSREELGRWAGRPALPVQYEQGEPPMQFLQQVPLFYVEDVVRSVAFYQDALGMTLVKPDELQPDTAVASLANGSAQLVIHEAGWHDEPQRGGQQRGERGVAERRRLREEAKDVVLMLYVDSCADAYRELQQRGYFDAELEGEETGNGFYLSDPDGNEICVAEMQSYAMDF